MDKFSKKPVEEEPLNTLAQKIHQNASDKGFWEADRNMGEMLMLATSELAEALEAHRAGRPSVWYASLYGNILPNDVYIDTDGLAFFGDEQWGEMLKPEGVAVEIVDCIIRCLDTLNSLDVDIDSLIKQKMAYNSTRPAKHGKAY